jgi:hypothetical protein
MIANSHTGFILQLQYIYMYVPLLRKADYCIVKLQDMTNFPSSLLQEVTRFLLFVTDARLLNGYSKLSEIKNFPLLLLYKAVGSE